MSTIHEENISITKLIAVVLAIILITFALLRFVDYLFNNVPSWFAQYQFNHLSGFQQKGIIMAYDSSLRIPKGSDSNYCLAIKDIKGNSIPKSISYVKNGLYIDIYCGCPPYDISSKTIDYKLFNNKIIYHCKSNIYVTKVIPDYLIK